MQARKNAPITEEYLSKILDEKLKGFAKKEDLDKLEVKIDKVLGMVAKNNEDDMAHEMIHESNSDDLVNLKNHVRHVERVLEIVPPFPAIA
jgi:hypothetical protein